MKIVVEEKLISDDLTKFWELENLGIEANATENISDDVTLKEFESGISFSDNRYSVRLPWKPGMKEQLQDNRTIQLDEEDRDVTRFLWNENPNGPEELIQSYRMTRVLFGVSSSPFLLAATIKHHLKRYVEKFPETCEMLNNSLYVDDLVSGRENVEQAFKTSLESVDIFKGASMILRKWQTNSPELRDRWKEIGMDIGQSVESKTQTLVPSKILGVAWNPDQDTFYFDTGGIIKFLKKRTNTKRCLLQAAGRIFDPVGFLSPFIIRLKILIQELWCLGLDWDEFFPKNLESSWNEWCEEVPELNTFSIPRYYLGYALQNEIDNIQIHCFSDSSKKAYARLSYKISKTVNYITSRYFWTDSSITYFWIKGSAARFKPFVKNRIKEIQKYTDPIEWRHCPGKDNPADLLSRGTQTTLFLIRQYYWIPSGQNRVRRVINRCLTCFKTRIRTVNQMMGDLPKDRVVPSRPFEKATHFEVVSDLTTDSFLASLRRFIARRSKPATIWSDNATNFKGAKNVLDILLKYVNLILYKNIVPKKIEAVLNSRPLCPLSADPADLQPLTPGHFLVEAPLLGIPEPSELLTNISLSSRWSLIQSLKNRFWKRWSKEYLGELQARKKWRLPLSNLKLGQLVMLKDPSKIPMEWTLGRIEGIHPGSDGLVRVIRIRTSRGVFTRTAASVCPLPFEDVGPPSNGGRDVPACQHKN
ncbi:integrase catalytic domain-containing protein [Trichonephila clavipes]|nr:integrase catalytic domain-containing protein [Trichonephila clavipes]